MMNHPERHAGCSDLSIIICILDGKPQVYHIHAALLASNEWWSQ